MVAGTRPDITSAEVKTYLETRFGVAPGTFLVYPHRPEDFLIMFRDAEAMLHVLHSPIPVDGLRLVFKRWRREAWATASQMDFRLRIRITGVPAHLWTRSTAQDILGSSCGVISLAPETESKASLREYLVSVGCVHPDLVPNEKIMVAPLPSTNLDVLPCLHYKAFIDILEVTDLRSPGGPPAPGGSGGHPPPPGTASGSGRGSCTGPGSGGGSARGTGPSGDGPQGAGPSGGAPAPSHLPTVGLGRPLPWRDAFATPVLPPAPVQRPGTYPLWGLQGIHLPASTPTDCVQRLGFLSASAAPFLPSAATVIPVVATSSSTPYCSSATAVRRARCTLAGVPMEPDFTREEDVLLSRGPDPMLLEASIGRARSTPCRRSGVVPIHRVFQRLADSLAPLPQHGRADADLTFVPVRFSDVGIPAGALSPRTQSSPVAASIAGLHRRVEEPTTVADPRSPPPAPGPLVADHAFVTTTRGSPAPGSLDGLVAEFCASVTREMEPPVLSAKPRVRRAKIPAPGTVLRRSSRIAALSHNRGTKPVTVAQNIIMRRLGLVQQNQAPDTTSFLEYTRLFADGLSDEHCLAIRELFGHMVDGSGQSCILEDEELSEAARELFPEDVPDGGQDQ
ncbi:unnamed protein product [Urochloa decumbens]|uniref:DUF4283 domain-containing protein n=1 Tax=Urochloa decumbens TaxID=240449 RepID=A0ABC9CEM7_9POAL